MGVITDRDTINKLRPFFDGDYGYIELLERIDDLGAAIPRREIVLEMLGKEKNGEHSILYIAACYANGYDARLIVSHPPDDRVWTEVKINGTWIHVDPSEKIVDDPYTYWRAELPLKNVMAYGIRNYENVTFSYLPVVCESCIG